MPPQIRYGRAAAYMYVAVAFARLPRKSLPPRSGRLSVRAFSNLLSLFSSSPAAPVRGILWSLSSKRRVRRRRLASHDCSAHIIVVVFLLQEWEYTYRSRRRRRRSRRGRRRSHVTLLEQHRTAQNRTTSPSSIFVYIGRAACAVLCACGRYC